MPKSTVHRMFVFCILCLIAFSASPAEEENKPQRFEAADSKGVTATRDDRAVYLKIKPDLKGSIVIPRLAAPLRSMHWLGHEPGGITLQPDPDRWIIRYRTRPEGARTLVLNFDDEPLLIDEVKPIEATGDGSFYLPGHLAKTVGEKIRYEPQTFKNTVGFWVGKEDQATWKINIEKPGRFNLAVLQGCGRGQGGSLASFVCLHAKKKANVVTLDFEVKETGHWQNFQWVQLGEVQFDEPGITSLSVIPKEIKKAALMDIRAIHLIRLPDKKR